MVNQSGLGTVLETGAGVQAVMNPMNRMAKYLKTTFEHIMAKKGLKSLPEENSHTQDETIHCKAFQTVPL